jgi:predicted MPP superfamily phosphohydrolase
MVLLQLLLFVAAFLGHFAIVVWVFNRLHTMPWPRAAIKRFERMILLAAMFVPVVYLARFVVLGAGLLPDGSLSAAGIAWLVYPVGCWLALLAVLPLWLIPKLWERPPAALLANESRDFDVAAHLGFRPVGDRTTDLLSRIAANEILRLRIQKKTLRLERLPPKLEGLTIAHLSDLHMTGHLTQPFYDAVVDQTNALEPDLILITGDIAEKVACLDWIAPTLGRLQAKCGKFFVLGNHEMKLPSVAPLREALDEAGIVDISSRAQSFAIRDTEILIAGTELPWFGAAPQIDESAEAAKTSDGQRLFRLLLSHSPDQFAWARQHDFDLMLAGHTHGGQIRLPYLGALIAPSRYGFRYASGVFYEAPTLLHVTRGIAGQHQIRLNCPPELALLRLVG